MKIEEFTICLHCGCNQEVVDNQMKALKPLENKYNVYWNNRIDRHPEIYPSYSQLINHSIATSPTEWVFLINDRTHPTTNEVEKMINLLENGYAWVGFFGVGHMAFSKELIRTIGWWDERFINGGWEDRDWIWRLYLANLAIYESCEGEYDQSWKSPLNIPGAHLSTPYWLRKWANVNNIIEKRIPEESYPHWDNLIGDQRLDIRKTWKGWNDSVLNYMYDKPTAGPSGSFLLFNHQGIKDHDGSIIYFNGSKKR